MAPRPPYPRRRKPRAKSTNVIPLAENSHSALLKPFSRTNFGKLPPELRENIFIQLLASPPPYAGYNFLPISPDSKKSPDAPKQFVHIKASWYQVTRTCRQIYRESHPIFFASRHYYLGNPGELARLLALPLRGVFRLDTINALYMKNLVKELPVYTKQKIDDILLNPNDPRGTQTRQQLESMTFKTLDYDIGFNLRLLKNLRTIGLGFRVGEEMFHVDLLYDLSGMRTGLVEFVDASHWLIRPQNPEDVWSIQCACFVRGNYGKGKNDEKIPYDRRRIELDVTDIDSRAPGLKDGDERYIEAQIQRSTVPNSRQRFLDSDEYDMFREPVPIFRDEDLSSPETDMSQLEVPQDQAENLVLPGASEQEEQSLTLESDANQSERSLILELHSEESQSSQAAADIDQEDEHDLFQSADEEVYNTQSNTHNDHQTEPPFLSSSTALVTDDAHTATADDRLSLLDTEDQDDQTQINISVSQRVARVADLQLNEEPVTKSRVDVAQEQPNHQGRANGGRLRTNLVYLSSSSRQPLLDIQDTPNPFTEEEMESYEEWQEQAFSSARVRGRKEQSPPIKTIHEHRPKTPNEASATATPGERPRTAAPQGPLGRLVSYIQESALFFLFLFLLVVTERLANAIWDKEG